MREALLKTRYGIPAALLILLVSAGVATAAVVVTFNHTITTYEPLSFTEKENPSTIYQGESAVIIVEASNKSTEQGYGILVDADVKRGEVDSITYTAELTDGSPAPEKLINSEPKLDKNLNGDGDRCDAWFNIAANETYRIVVTVDSADDAAIGDLCVTLNFQREAEYS